MAIPTSPFLYIRSLVNPDFVLTARDGRAVMTWIDPTLRDPNQQWQIDNLGGEGRIVTASGLALTQVSDAQGAPVAVDGSGSSWLCKSFDSASDSWIIQITENNPLVINLLKSSMDQDAPVGLWNWAGGAPNELWQLEAVSDVEPYDTDTSFLGTTNSLMLYAPEPGVTVGQDAPTSWTNPHLLWTLTYWATGISLQNQFTGLWLAYDGGRRNVVQNPQMTSQSLFTTAPTGDQQWCLASWGDDQQALTVLGNDPQSGAPVGMWDWSAEAPQMWVMWLVKDGGKSRPPYVPKTRRPPTPPASALR